MESGDKGVHGGSQSGGEKLKLQPAKGKRKVVFLTFQNSSLQRRLVLLRENPPEKRSGGDLGSCLLTSALELAKQNWTSLASLENFEFSGFPQNTLLRILPVSTLFPSTISRSKLPYNVSRKIGQIDRNFGGSTESFGQTSFSSEFLPQKRGEALAKSEKRKIGQTFFSIGHSLGTIGPSLGTIGNSLGVIGHHRTFSRFEKNFSRSTSHSAILLAIDFLFGDSFSEFGHRTKSTSTTTSRKNQNLQN